MFRIERIKPNKIDLFEDMNALFAEEFDDQESYTNHRPSKKYINKLLRNEYFIPLIARQENEIVGALAAYELVKFEQERSEIYIYDLAVKRQYRRKGIAASLINELRKIAKQRGAYVIFVQADTGEEDKPAIALYTKLGGTSKNSSILI